MPTGAVELKDRAHYMFDLLQSLIVLARQEPAPMSDLIYFMEMAALEADRLRQGRGDGK